ncbi:CMP-sialic acid transporter 4 (CMP-SA-Tr 4) (CMP-Sia-Tr 4) [Durusdinium trenchii]|uniref:CMP-sialic acid transporter 4 (CMP-SA-Tr 4) (CMP-Sia-Tr 4) n=1 Tax=Durusdinium trenchii TaxID=1381693 RepID=A0ABP0MXE5_9DINO
MAQLDVAIFIVSAVIMAMKPLLLHLTGDAVREDVALPPAFFQLAVEALKALICVLVLLLRRQCGLSAVVWNGWWHTASFALPAAVYLLMNVLTVIAARLLQPPMLQLIASIKILITAIASRIVMSKKLEPLQWLALVLLTVGVAVGGRGKSTMESGEVSEVPLLGVALMLFNCTLSSLGGVLTERALKQRSSGELTIFATNLHMALHSLSMNASALSLVTSAELPRLELLQMSDFVALSNEALNGILISLLMKRIDAIAKNYVFSVSVFTTAAMSAVVLRLWPPWQFYLGSSICAASMALYAQGGRPKKIQ